MVTRTLSKAEGFELVYKAFQDINFKSFDFNTVKQSLIDYVKLYFPEVFNDFIESSEFIAHLEIFAYVAELFIYRVDINTHENFLPVAQRKDSVLRLAKFISYNGSRNVPGRGLLKINTIQTSEPIYDSRGQLLQNVVVRWNDQLNPYWKEQFIQIFNRISSQPYGTVSTSDRVQFQDVLLELYQLKTQPLELGVLPYSVVSLGTTIPMECVPAQLSEFGPTERRPYGSASNFSVLYGSDGLGDQSNMTGFFMMTKQGTLSKTRLQLDGRTPNQVIPINNININDTDVWVNNVDPTTNEIIDDGSNPTGKSGEWISVNLESAENITFNTISNPNKYEIETRDDDKINIIFGDGEFARIPSGTFDIWTRSSINQDTVIPKSSIQDISFNLQYKDQRNQVHTVTVVASATNPIQNGYASEDIERIRRVAPSVYYTQDRMVNGRDYNSYLLRDQSILKLSAINRTFAGQSKYRAYSDFGGDPSETYDNVQLFGTDLAVYYQDGVSYQYAESYVNPLVVFNNNIEPILGMYQFRTYRLINEYVDLDRIVFNDSIDLVIDPQDPTSTIPDFNNPITNKLERSAILYALGSDVVVNGVTYSNPAVNFPIEIYFDNSLARWRTTSSTVFDPFEQQANPTIVIQIDKSNIGSDKWVIQYVTTDVIAESNTTNFWNNTTEPIISFDSGNASRDTIEILEANKNATRDQLLQQSILIPVIGQPVIPAEYIDVGQPNTQRLILSSTAADQSSTPIDQLLDPSYTFTGPFVANQEVTLPFYYVIGKNDFTCDSDLVVETPGTGISNKVLVTSAAVSSFTINKTDFVYFTRLDTSTPWSIIDNPSVDDLNAYADDTLNTNYDRKRGRSGLNYMWRHYTTQYHLIDPAATNIVDVILLTKSYYVNVRRWLAGELLNAPVIPTPFELRSAYQSLLSNAMISDTVVLKHSKVRIIFGSKSIAELRSSFRIVRSSSSILTDNQIKLKVIDTIERYFDINRWEFGQAFYFTELAAAIHNELGANIETVTLVPLQSSNYTDQLLMQISPNDDEVLVPDVTVNDIDVISTLDSRNVKQLILK